MRALAIRFYIGLSKSDDADLFRAVPVSIRNGTYRDRAQKAKTILSKTYPSFTALDAHGYWEGLSEPALVVEVIREDGELERAAAAALAAELALQLGQRSVGLAFAPVQFEFVEAGDR